MISEARLNRTERREAARKVGKQRHKKAQSMHRELQSMATKNFGCDCAYCAYRMYSIRTKVFDPGPSFEAPNTCKNYPRVDAFLCVDCGVDANELGGRCENCDARHAAVLNAQCPDCSKPREELKNATCYACADKLKNAMWGAPDPKKLVIL